MEKERCQSCGMLMGMGVNGTNKDKSVNKEYCKYCFRDGSFTEPNITLRAMINSSAIHMSTMLGTPKDRAREFATRIIPNLKRWKK